MHFVPFARKIRLKRKRKDQETDEELSLGRSVTEAFLPSIRLVQKIILYQVKSWML